MKTMNSSSGENNKSVVKSVTQSLVLLSKLCEKGADGSKIYRLNPFNLFHLVRSALTA